MYFMSCFSQYMSFLTGSKAIVEIQNQESNAHSPCWRRQLQIRTPEKKRSALVLHAQERGMTRTIVNMGMCDVLTGFQAIKQ